MQFRTFNKNIMFYGFLCMEVENDLSAEIRRRNCRHNVKVYFLFLCRFGWSLRGNFDEFWSKFETFFIQNVKLFHDIQQFFANFTQISSKSSQESPKFQLLPSHLTIISPKKNYIMLQIRHLRTDNFFYFRSKLISFIKVTFQINPI